jgi:hypothetical protein
MNDACDALDRLFQAARQAPESCLQLPTGFEGRVIAAWRHASAEEDIAWVLALLQRAILAACLIALLSVAFSYLPARETNQNELALADTAIKMSLLP